MTAQHLPRICKRKPREGVSGVYKSLIAVAPGPLSRNSWAIIMPAMGRKQTSPIKSALGGKRTLATFAQGDIKATFQGLRNGDNAGSFWELRMRAR